MAANQFGQRRAPPIGVKAVSTRVARPAPVASARPATVDGPSDPQEVGEGVKLLALFPILTAGIILFLTLVFLAEERFAPDIRGNTLGISSLVALGGASWNLVYGQGEWQRLFLAPIYHSSLSHLLGNCFALAFVGSRLEPLLGRWWMAAVFALSAMGGMAGSMLGNPPAVVTVGASGAITGLIGCLFALSFHGRADAAQQHAMRMTALKFGVPALAPLIWGASGGTDYFAHLGGAIAGALVGGAIAMFWDGSTFRPGLQKVAAGITLAGLALSGVSAAMASTRFKAHAVEFSHLIPTSEMPAGMDIDMGRANELAARYPRDPRGHLFRAWALIKGQKLLAAEQELNAARDQAHELGETARAPMTALVNGTLAMIYAWQGRSADAQAMAQKVCATKTDAAMAAKLVKAKLCK